MPLYEYQCQACGERFEQIQKFADPPLNVCPQCGKGPVERLLSSPAFQFKGSGWYITDYARKKESGGAEKSDKADKGEKTETKADAKTETKAEKTDAKSTGDTKSKPGDSSSA